MNKKINLALVTALASQLTFAAGAPVGNQFSSGQPARANEVNENFQELADRIDENTATSTTNAANVSTNAASISNNASSISSNSSNISSNAISINTNTTDISTNADSLAINTDNITTNTSGITANAQSITANTSDIVSNTLTIDNNASNIQTNSAAISSNTANITDNTNDISSNTSAIDTLNASVQSLVASNQSTDWTLNEELASRVFLDMSSSTPGTCDQRSDTFNYDTNAKTLEQTVIYENSSDGTDCSALVLEWDYATDVVANNYRVTISGGSPVDYLYTLDEPWLYLRDGMTVGESWASLSERTLSVDGGVESEINQEYRRTSFLGIKDVSVPAGDFEDCFLIEDVRVLMDDSEERRVYYHCNGPGLVRWISLTYGQDYQLQSYTEN